MRLRRGLYPTDALLSGNAWVDYAVDSLSRAFRLQSSLTTSLQGSYDVVICGYPRSGNSFLARIVKHSSRESLRIGVREHNPLVVYAARRYSLPVLIPVRDPKMTVASWALFNDVAPEDKILLRFIRGYTQWHNFVIRYRDRDFSAIVPFEVLTRDPNYLIHSLNVLGDFGFSLITVNGDAVLEDLENSERIERGDLFNTRGSVPRNASAKRREEYLEVLGKPHFAHELGKAQTAYSTLVASMQRQLTQH